jgi:hypothetical protein
VDFLGKSEMFGPLTMRDARRLWNALGTDLRVALDACDTETLRIRGISLERCRRLANGWQNYWSLRDVKELLNQYRIHPRVAASIQCLYGSSANQLLHENPYRLAAFLNWKDLDAVATSIRTESSHEARYLGACNQLLLDMQRRGRFFSRYSYVADRLSSRLGSVSAATDSLRLAVAKNMAFVSARAGVLYIHTQGVEIVERALCASLLGLPSTHDATANPSTDSHTLSSGAAIEAINASQLTFEATAIALAQSGEKVLHVLGTIDVDAAKLIEHLSHSSIALARVLSDDLAYTSFQNQDVVIHDADQISFVTLSKLIRRLQGASRVRLLGRLHGLPFLTDGPTVFADIVASKTLPVSDLKIATNVPLRDGKPDFRLSPLTSLSRPPEPVLTVVHWCTTSGHDEDDIISSHYRECAHYGSTVLLTTHAVQASRWNIQFHNETVEYRAARGERTYIVRLRHQQSASDGDPVIVLKSDLGRGLVAGIRGTLSTSDRAPYFHPVEGDIAFDALGFDGVGTMSLNPEQLSNCMLSYAMHVRAPFLASVDYVVVPIQKDAPPELVALLLSRAVSHARRAVVLISESRPTFPISGNTSADIFSASLTGFGERMIAAQSEQLTRESRDEHR